MPAAVSSPRSTCLARFRRVRQHSVDMCAPLSAEEYRLQPIADVSPPWWNLGHTSWFFARNVLVPFGGRCDEVDEQYDFLLNSYYASLGQRLPRHCRGSVSRPTTDEIHAYRTSVDARIVDLVETIDDERLDELLGILEIGSQHEQQHQELFYTEIKFIRHQNIADLREAYVERVESSSATHSQPMRFMPIHGGLQEFGNVEGGWCWDNELPVHRYFLEPLELADRLVTNGEFLEFMADGAYENPLLWLDNGWQQVQDQGWQSPLYWEKDDGEWRIWTLQGMLPLRMNEPVCHVSFYEADAFARWKAASFHHQAKVRLPSEREWEQTARMGDVLDSDKSFLEGGMLHPASSEHGSALEQMAGCLWQWTSSYYEPYPGYQPFPGVLAEYNGKFMDNQRVLRGGSCVTPRDHYRTSYRNFWPASTRFQFTGIRLARS